MRREALLFAAVLFVYAYFYQGYGYNQDAHFDTVRALVERDTFDISPYWKDEDGPGFTGDVSFGPVGVYSSKPPGLPLVVVPFYAAVNAIERRAGLDVNTPRIATINQQLCTIWGSAIPAAILAVMLFRFFRSRQQGEMESLLLASGFAFGSLMLPYSGMLMAETLVAACLFAAWRWVDDDDGPKDSHAALAGVLLGVACLAQISAAPLVPVFFIVTWLRRRRAAMALLAGPVAALIVQLFYQHAVFGSAFAASYSRVDPQYIHPGQVLGHFDWPDVRRFWWLSFHPVRGLLYCCPVLLLPLLALIAPRHHHRRWIIPAAVIANFVLFNLTYSAWTGGWGVGPRYLIPAMAFMMIFASPALKKFRRISVALIVISVASMLAVAAVRVQWRIEDIHGPPVGDDPVAGSFLTLTKRLIARSHASTNLGLMIGLPGLWSLLPPLAVVAILGTWIVRLRSSRSMGLPPMSSENDGRDAHATEEANPS